MTKDFARTTFGPRERTVLRAFAEAMFFPEGDVTRERLDAIVAEADAFVSPASQMLRIGLRLLLVVLRWSPLAFGRFRAFDELPVAERTEHLGRMEHARRFKLPLVFIAYKTLFTIIHYEAPNELVPLGYPRRTP